jgi:hypothetical protein
MLECRRIAVRGPLSPSLRFALVGMVAAIALAGCASTPGSSTDTGAATANTNPTVVPSATPALSPTAPLPLSFVATGSMHTARESATATLLKNGKVLIAGGEAQSSLPTTVYASAELYDPATGKFTNTGSMAAARVGATAISLSDGRVLIAGGQGCPNPKDCRNIDVDTTQRLVYLASAEIYDPATGKFTATGSLTSIVQSATSVLLPDGKVLIVDQANQANSWGQLYDPETGKFARTSKFGGFTEPVTATLLPSGKVLATGDGGELFDETSGKFTKISLALPPGAPSSAPLGVVIDRTTVYTATLLPNGRVLLFEGGYLETYDPATGACADAGFISPGGEWADLTATLLHDGRVLFAGGYSDPDLITGAVTDWAVLYDPSGGPEVTGSLGTARAAHTATLLQDGSVLIAGGEYDTGSALASAELFKP